MKSLILALILIPALSQGEILRCGLLADQIQAQEDCAPASLQESPWTPPGESQWVRDVRGIRSDFVNMYVHGSFVKFEAALRAGGWTKSADNNKKDNARYVHSVFAYEHARMAENSKVHHAPGYLEKMQDQIKSTAVVIESMPVSNEFMCGQLQTAAFEKQNNPLGGRHHLRIWDTKKKDAEGQPILAVVGSHDIRIMFDRKRPKQFFLNHRVELNVDLERDIIVKDLKVSDAIALEQDLPVKFSCPLPEDKVFSADQRVKEIYLR